MEKNYNMPPVVWLKITDYMHGWIQHELGCGVQIRDQKVVCVQHLPGAREVLRMETVEDTALNSVSVSNTMSASRNNMLTAGLSLDTDYIKQTYGITREALKLYVPIECPNTCMTKHGVLRSWTQDVCFGKEQANAMLRLLRTMFWKAVETFNKQYAEKMDGEKYPAVDMIEAFCEETNTPGLYVESIRREWQRRIKRVKDAARAYPRP